MRDVIIEQPFVAHLRYSGCNWYWLYYLIFHYIKLEEILAVSPLK